MKISPLFPLAASALLGLAACGTISGADATRAATIKAQQTAQVVVSRATGTVELKYALYNENDKADASRKFALTVSDYSVCGWGVEHGWSGHPNRSNILAMYLLNETGGSIGSPVVGTYAVTAPPAGATGLFVDPTTSGFGNFGDTCQGNWPGLKSGQVVLTRFDQGIIEGSFDLVLADGSTISGALTTANCTGGEVDGTDGKSTDCSW